MKIVFTLSLIFFNCIWGFSQNNYEINSELIIKDYYHMSVSNAEKIDDKLYVSCRVQNENRNFDFPAVITISNNQIINKIKIQPKNEMFFGEVKVIDKKILIIGETPTGNDEEMQDYIGCFDFEGKEIFSLKLEKKYNGLSKAFYNKDFFELFTMGSEGFFFYKISYSGDVIEKKSISLKNDISDVIKNFNSNYVVLSDSLDINGKNITYALTIFDKDMKIQSSKNIKTVDWFRPCKLMVYDNGYLIAGNVDGSHSFIPCIYFVNKDLTIRKSSIYHFEPEHYKFKSSFKLKDIYYDSNQKNLMASGIAKIVNDETHIIFSLTEDRLMTYKLLDKAGFQGNNKLLYFNNSYDVFEDIKLNDEYDTKIKMVNIKVK